VHNDNRSGERAAGEMLRSVRHEASGIPIAVITLRPKPMTHFLASSLSFEENASRSYHDAGQARIPNSLEAQWLIGRVTTELGS
jgi:hypothetical protein